MTTQLLTTRILVVDDEPSIVQVVCRFLGREGYQVDSAADGEQALIKIQGHRPDVVLLDIKMPVMDGLSVCETLRSDFRTRGLPVILFSGNCTSDDRLRGYRTGADDYLAKPFSLEELKIRIEGAMARRQWDQWTHPMTRLPGSPGIEEEVRRRLVTQDPFAFAYIDIDFFKAFNDAYGYEAGDSVIKEVGDLLLRSISHGETLRGFPGHIGGDDFVLIALIDEMKKVSEVIARQFDVQRLAHYNPVDRARESVVCKNRLGQEQIFPLMTLSIAVVSTATRRIPHYARLAEISSELKGYVKKQDHQGRSLILWDRRRDPDIELENSHE